MDQSPLKFLTLRSHVTLFFLFVLGACSSLEQSPVSDAEKPSAVTVPAATEKNSKPTQASTASEDPTDSDSFLDEEEMDGVDPQAVAEMENSSIGKILSVDEPDTQTLYDNSRYDFPITMNSRVEGWIDYFTGRGRSHMERYLARSSRYVPLMREILKKEGLPEDLVYLALIESGFNLSARSVARAIGPWQFMKGTGARYGLRIDAWIDERHDPILSTAAAASYLKDLYLMFESWYLAAAAYNAGEYKILRAIQSSKTNNFWRLAATRTIRRETKDYVPKLIAAAIIAKNADRYGFDDIVYQEPLDFESIVVDFPVTLARLADILGTSEEILCELNPQLRRRMVPPGIDSYEIRVPVGQRLVAQRAVAQLKSDITKVELPKQYRVRAGDTLRSIASRHRVGFRDLALVNNLSPKERLSPGLALIIPGLPSWTKPREAKAANVATSNSEWHTVRRGESLWSISEKYNCTVREIFEWNQLKSPRLYPGARLRVAAPAGQSASVKPRLSPHLKANSASRNRIQYHRVQSGESLWSIANRYKVEVSDLKRWNNLGNKMLVKGRKLKIVLEPVPRA